MSIRRISPAPDTPLSRRFGFRGAWPHPQGVDGRSGKGDRTGCPWLRTGIRMTFSLTLSMPSACPASQGETGSWNLPLWHWQPLCSFHEFSRTIEPPSQSEAWDAAPGEGDTRGEACPWASQHPCCHLTVRQMPGALLACLAWPDSLLSCSDLRPLTPLLHHSRESPHLPGPQQVTREARPRRLLRC